MDNDNGTLNGADSLPSEVIPVRSGDLSSTVEFTPVENPVVEPKVEEPQAPEKADGQKVEETLEEKPKKGGGNQEDRFDKHPRFQQILSKVKAAEERAKELESRLNSLLEGKDKKVQNDGHDSSNLAGAEILDLLNENPNAFLARIKQEVKAELSAAMEKENKERTLNQALDKTFKTFAKEHSDFDDLWEAGDLSAYMEEHPGHNAISAYYAVTAEAREKELAEKIEQAKELAKKEAIDLIKIKKTASSIPASPASQAARSPVAAELRSTKSSGGLVSVLARRSAERTNARP